MQVLLKHCSGLGLHKRLVYIPARVSRLGTVRENGLQPFAGCGVVAEPGMVVGHGA